MILAEVNLLVGPSSSLGGHFEVKEPFFQALEHAQSIQKDCRNSLLPSAETTALEVMDQMNHYQDQGLQRLYRWTQSQCRQVNQVLHRKSSLKSKF